MIFVTLGTQDFAFERLLIALDDLIEQGVLQDEILVQAGHTTYQSKHMNILGYIPMDEFQQYLEDATLIVCHGGVGSIVESLKLQKKVVAMARLEDYKEHENNHQVEIVQRFHDQGYILGCTTTQKFKKAFQGIDDFKPKSFESNQDEFCELVKDNIDKLLGGK